jgi:hypothetical protein
VILELGSALPVETESGKVQVELWDLQQVILELGLASL